MPSCPPFLNADSKAGDSQTSCEYTYLFLSRIALTSEKEPPFMQAGRLKAESKLFPNLSPYSYTLRKLRNGFLYALLEKGGDFSISQCQDGLIGGLELFGVLPGVKKFWIAFSDIEWTNDIEKMVKADPDKWMQRVTLEKGQPYLAEPGCIQRLVEEYRDATGHLMSIRGLHGQLVQSLITEQGYMAETYPVSDPEDQFLIRRWLDSAEWAAFLSPGERAARCASFTASSAFLLALHDPMGISLDFGSLNCASVDTMSAHNKWYEYPTSMAAYVAAVESSTRNKRHDAREHWHTQWNTRKYLGPAKQGTPKDAPCPYRGVIIPQSTETERWITIPCLHRHPETKEQVNAWWLVRQYYDPDKPQSVPQHLQPDRLTTYVHTRQREASAFRDAFEILLTSWRTWLTHEGPWGIAHPFAWYGEEKFEEYEYSLAQCLNGMAGSALGMELAARCILHESMAVNELVMNASRGGNGTQPVTEFTSAVIDALGDGFASVHKSSAAKFDAYLDNYRTRLDKNAYIQSLQAENPAESLLAVAEILARQTVAGEAGAPAATVPSSEELWAGRPVSGRLSLLASASEQGRSFHALADKICQPYFLEKFYAFHKQPALLGAHKSAGKVLASIARPVAGIGLGICGLNALAQPSLANTFGVLRASYAFLRLLGPSRIYIEAAEAAAKQASQTALQRIGPRALAAGGKFWNIGPFSLVYDGAVMADLVSSQEDAAIIAQGVTILAYCAAGAAMGPGAPAIAAIFFIQFAGGVAVEYLKRSPVEKWLDTCYWGKKYESSCEAAYPHFKNVYPLLSYQNTAENLSEPPTRENIHPKIDKAVPEESKARQTEWLRRLCEPSLKVVSLIHVVFIRLEAKQFIPGVSAQTIEVFINGGDPWKLPGNTYHGRIKMVGLDKAVTREAAVDSLVLIPWRPRYDLENGMICWEMVLDNKAIRTVCPARLDFFNNPYHEVSARGSYMYKNDIPFPTMEDVKYVGNYLSEDRKDLEKAAARLRKLMLESPEYASDPRLIEAVNFSFFKRGA